MREKNPVVITGMSAITALGHGADETWNALLEGRQGIQPVMGFDAGGFECRVGAQVRQFDTRLLRLDSKLAHVLDLHSFMLMKCAREAFAQAGLENTNIAAEDIGLFIGMGMVDQKFEDLLPGVLASVDSGGALDMGTYYASGYQQIYPLITLSMLNNISPCEAAIRLNIRGENTVFSPDADSGAQAIAEGVKALLAKKARVVLVGGVSEKITAPGLARAHLQGILNTADFETMPCRPFAENRNGTVLGEGCGILSLELREEAKARGAASTIALTGYGCAFEREENYPAPTSDAVFRGMRQAIAAAEIDPSDVDVVLAHGDGTVRGDANEIEAIQEVFAGRPGHLPVFSSKGFLGHMLAGAIAVDVILGTYMMSRGVIPPTLRSVPVDAAVKFDLVTEQPLKAAPRRMLLNCRSHEGQCASLVIEATD